MAHNDRNQDATLYIGNLDERVTDSIIWELMTQAGPVVNVHLPKDRVTQMTQGYGFCEFQSEDDADYAIKIMNSVKLYGKPMRINKASQDKKYLDIGANLFIGSLDPDVDEKLLYDTFGAFGKIVQPPKIGRDPDTNQSKGYAFISFDSFEASDAAIEAMNGQYLGQKPINVSYSLKKDGKGERHGSAAERLLAAQAKKNLGDTPSTGVQNKRFAEVGTGNFASPQTVPAYPGNGGPAATATPPVVAAPSQPIRPSLPPGPPPPHLQAAYQAPPPGYAPNSYQQPR